MAMKKFLVIYTSSVSARQQMASATPEQAKAGMEAWMAWAQSAGKSIVDMGAPLGDAANIVDGKPVATGSEIGGFSILQAESREALAATLAKHPHFHMGPGAAIEVHEMLPIPGMR